MKSSIKGGLMGLKTRERAELLVWRKENRRRLEMSAAHLRKADPKHGPGLPEEKTANPMRAAWDASLRNREARLLGLIKKMETERRKA
jgi:hypothetical protein